MALMLAIVLAHAWRTASKGDLSAAAAVIAAVAAALWFASPALVQAGNSKLILFLVIFVAVTLAAGVPIAFCFGVGAISYLAFATQVPTMVMIGRMDEGMSGLILLSVPIFVLLGCILDATGMGKAIIDFLASVLGHIKAGMSYVLLGSLFIVSGISGSKVSDMATVAPALFPEMRRRGHSPKEMIALLATGAAMADTVPPSIVLIVLGAAAGVSIAGLFTAGVTVALVLLLALAVLARWNSRNENLEGVRRAPAALVRRTLIVGAPALILPFIIRFAVTEGVATATEVSTIAVVYALFIGVVLYGGLGWRKLYDMLVETAALTGAILLILGTALAMAWVITQAGVAQTIATFMTGMPGGWVSFMAVSMVLFLLLGCILEGLPALVLMAPLTFPIARSLGINDVHYSMVIVTAMNIGLMAPPIGIGFYLACKIGNVPPDEAIGAIWPYLVALLVGLLVIAFVPWISTGFLGR
jgi:tripartite ATP-independent transporter DctM subunit